MGTLWERAQCAYALLLSFQEKMARPNGFEPLTPSSGVEIEVEHDAVFGGANLHNLKALSHLDHFMRQELQERYGV